MKKKQKAETKKPSILDKLKKFKDIVAKTPKKDKEKRKEPVIINAGAKKSLPFLYSFL